MGKQKNIYLFVVGVLWTMLAVQCRGKNHEYQTSIKEFRTMKNEKFNISSSSPLSKKQLIKFRGLSFFEPNIHYRCTAQFIPSQIPAYVSLFQSDEVKQIHVVRGLLNFKLNGLAYSLKAYSSAGQAEHILFVPFSDTHESSYPGGRYLDGTLLNDSACLLDFNLSYNPYCVYNKKFKCAAVPTSNALNTSIPAGEKWNEDY